VFFNEGWVEYADRQNYLLEADIGVSVHLDHVETEFSFRTRILDYFWASLPVVATRGDSLAELIDHHQVGLTVPSGDVDALEAALYALLSDDVQRAECRKNMPDLCAQYAWSKVLTPLVEFCRAPRRAPDLLDPDMAALVGLEPYVRPHRPGLIFWREDLATIKRHIAAGEWRLMATKVTGRVRRNAST
jgi:hypothetical protein